MKKVVIDQNITQNSDKVREILSDPSNQIIITDNLFIETLKSEHWKTSARESFRYLSEAPERVVVAKAHGQLLREESELKKPTSLEDVQLTTSFRDFLKSFSIEPEKSLDMISDGRKSATDKAIEQQLNHQQNKATLEGIIDCWEADIGQHKIKLLRQEYHKSPRNYHTMSELLTSLDGVKLIGRNIMEPFDLTPQEAANLIINRSSVLCLVLCFHGYALKWISMGGLNGLTEEKITNELMDMDYLAISLLCDEFITQEKKLIELYHVMKGILSKYFQTINSLFKLE